MEEFGQKPTSLMYLADLPKFRAEVSNGPKADISLLLPYAYLSLGNQVDGVARETLPLVAW